MVTSRSRRRLSPEARRAELIDAAIRLLRSGRQVTNWVQAVTTEADAAKGTFYVYFSSWEEMLAAVRERVLREYVDRFHRLADSTEPIDWWATLDAECAAAIEEISRPGGLHAAVFHANSELTDDGPIDTIAAIARALRRGMDDGAFRPVDPHIAATILFTVLHAAADAIAAGEQRERWLEAVRDLARQWLEPAGER
ncbi:TetR/AcrR family transcriptional regulator [Nonomuraea gerenzanensis]|uniref:Transcriptional regulator, TetR family n=1 Tax=Nonomuraea gerenzanensis TaxID=93944 RepID=A0A1M4ECU2_9ACTN|nr:TetR/AcrR family transcriptional regulator [Nonomuraea gerenzanensis]UBU08299.1 TetR/AcrR family transcriptional regulator [Nonomuraea gerenzanensis]SBO96630.1 Transcriptional regulator, TetR family [Nonomuraea gerenzanensis]